MKRFLIAVGLAAATGCAGVQVPKEQLTAPGALLFNGYANPQVDCYRCHNGTATGTFRGPNLSKKVPEIGDDQIASTIQSGKSLMPSFKGKISDDEQKQIIEWLRTRFPSKAP